MACITLWSPRLGNVPKLTPKGGDLTHHASIAPPYAGNALVLAATGGRRLKSTPPARQSSLFYPSHDHYARIRTRNKVIALLQQYDKHFRVHRHRQSPPAAVGAAAARSRVSGQLSPRSNWCWLVPHFMDAYAALPHSSTELISAALLHCTRFAAQMWCNSSISMHIP